jgi:hypothetical protein
MREATIRFREAGAPVAIFETKARVRAPITVRSSEVVFDPINPGETESQRVIIENYSNADWNEVRVKPSSDWIAVEIDRVGSSDGQDGPREMWELRITAKGGDLVPGWYRGSVSISTELSDSASQNLPVVMLVAAPVRAIPSSMFFGSITKNAQSRKVFISVANQSAELDNSDVTCSHDLGQQLELNMIRRSPSRWELVGDLKPSNDPIVKGQIRVTVNLPGGESSINIPVLAEIKEPQ